MMNKEQFLEKLGKLKGKFQLYFGINIRTIESDSTSLNYKRSFCPIEAVLLEDEKKYIPAWSSEVIGKVETDMIDQIIRGADFSINSLKKNPEALAMREKMLNVLGLEEPNE
ncbi:hypothetical protein C4577_02985 [Candidatus Parcubacteria bacterium]|nr:MAG: hypothetical protein C4577_02985 [Candidatus Parcubacteria bacterium]